MAGKDTLQIIPILKNVDMTSAFSSEAISIKFFDNIEVTLYFTGTPVGTFYANIGADGLNWFPLPLNPVPVAQGQAGKIFLDLNQLAAEKVMISYVPTSGTGTVNGYISAKMV